MKFSDRLNIGNQIDVFCDKNKIKINGLGILSAIEMLGYELIKKKSSLNPEKHELKEKIRK